MNACRAAQAISIKDENCSAVSAEKDQLLKRLNRLWEVVDSKDSQDGVSRSQGTTPLPVRGVSNQDSVGKYRLKRLLGTGAFGVVYEAYDQDLGRKVALKLPRLEVLLDQEKRTRFSHEALVAAQLDHPGIVRVYEAQLNDAEPYIASALCQGPTLAQWLKEDPNRADDWRQIVLIVAEVADAIDYAHRQGVFHRDIKPANILMEPQPPTYDPQANDVVEVWTPKVTDFGLAKLINLQATDTRSSLMLGTPAYMAPELLTRAGSSLAPSATSDVYSLGVVLHESLTGQLPISGGDYIEALDNVRKCAPVPLRKHRPSLPEGLEKVCRKCLEKNPETRYLSAGELAHDLRQVVAGKPIEGKSTRWRERLGFWLTRPERVSDAGWFTVVWESIFVTWLLLIVVLLPVIRGIEIPHQVYYSSLAVVLAAVSVGPVIYFGWLTTRKVRWGLYAGLVLTGVKLPLFIRAVFAQGLYFEELFQGNALLKLAFHLMFAICMSIQAVLFIGAYLADRKHDVCRPSTELLN